ncbi:putative hydro-lyase [Peribacillus sp. TH16]|uniref:putative hydro-lyase n=1 Tax=unclassified Peribacillus TaxID=2675266 RepID=UPI001911664E|nr:MULTISPECIES: putative hydro-lyase [unclassified Peribacillus]MBK5446537.1 putative hydro-lyase [Peribacillus sp. TH24]MBK5458741.1 putative hydro-lyase [Peribacillus sp. TH27]MBK5480650.1 putative hydro-lyase [Peribacillus sp. TH16]
MINLSQATPAELRAMIRNNELIKPTAGMANGYAQANLAILKKEHAFDFLLFCQRNPKSCPLLDVTEIGSPIPKFAAQSGDIRTDIPKYRIYKYGELVEEVTDISDYWEDDMVGFLIGCSFTFEHALLNNDISIRHIEEDCNVPMYKTNISCIEAGIFHGKMVASMRPIPQQDVVRAAQVTSRFPAVHGGPIHIGDPGAIGVSNIQQPDFGDAVTIREGEVPVFWACGVTPQSIAMETKPAIMITHAPGHMFITDIRDEKLGVL